MSFTSYQQEAMKTALYPNIGNNILYPMLGLMGEAGEVSGKISKILRDDNGTLTPDRRLELKDELGDIVWFIAAVCQEANLDMGALYLLAQSSSIDLEKTWKAKDDTLFKLNFKLFQQVSHMSMLVEQSIYTPPKENVDLLAPLATDMVLLLADMIDMCTACSLNIEEVAQRNLEKLASRQERGVIQGSGDTR